MMYPNRKTALYNKNCVELVIDSGVQKDFNVQL